jgi:translation elongation factor EF-4
MAKLQLNDAAFHYMPESSVALVRFSWFSRPLHMEIIASAARETT